MAEPIDLDKLSVSLAASVISAQRYLMQANQELGDLHQGNAFLADMPQPRFSLGTVSFDVPYVVQDIQPPEPPSPADVRVAKDVVLSGAELASLRRGASEQSVQRLEAFLSDYAQLKDELRRSIPDRQTPRTSNAPAMKRLAPEVELGRSTQSELATGASKMAVTKLARLIEDYQSARGSYLRIKETLAGGGLPRLAVRIDPESIASAGGNVHRMNLQFNSEDAPSVKVQGQSLT